MPRHELPFDAAHPRCIYPEFGQKFTALLDETGKRPIQVAKAIDVSAEIVRGYRRGFAHPSPQTMKRLEAYFGRLIDDPPKAPQEVVSLPATLTVQRHSSGDLILSFRVAPDQLSRFLAK